ncbi:ATP-binding cassette domain-containing protein [uncultured Aquincola sp.]|uniref:ABC transporter ATP-binding protein n=1 Tax=uncultured Aquincola sp. TaxID=886556 RepID=UPI0032B16436
MNPPAHDMTAPDPQDPVFQARGLAFTFAGASAPLFQGLDLYLRPGLTLLQGGDGSGKTTLLRIVAGVLVPTAGQVLRCPPSLYADDATDAADDAVTAHDWLAARRARHAGWQPTAEQALVEGFALAEHLGKRLEMLSTGSRRKVGLVAAGASGAALTLLDNPFAALDAPSSRCLAALLTQAARGERRAWLVADYGRPPLLAGVPLAAVLDLDQPAR